ncbi:O-antigen ligase family protein [Maribacter sp. R77961]|uniref:O-antigen ligase family protein n=1 Tax=Maribacter sp. R77961 TaxID=3093871 RepID=UPI0037C58638
MKYIYQNRREILKHLILSLFLLNLPGFLFVKLNPSVSSFASIASYILLIIYYISAKDKGRPNMWMFFLVILYYSVSTLSGQEFTPEPYFYLIDIFKLLVVVICGQQLIMNTTLKELNYYLIIGALTVLAHIFLFFDPIKDSGRFYGFYLNPNSAGFICLIGYSFTFALKNKPRLINQIIFTAMGLLTFSRTFLLIWVLINIISLKVSFKNIKFFVYGFIIISILISFSDLLPFQNVRLKQLTDFFNGNQINVSEVNEDSRSGTWSLYYSYIINKPFFGNGLNSFEGGLVSQQIGFPVGVHNSYLKVLGEAGLFVFIYFLMMNFKMVSQSIKLFRSKPYLFIALFSLLVFLLTNHEYFSIHYILLISMWIQNQLIIYSINNRLLSNIY